MIYKTTYKNKPYITTSYDDAWATAQSVWGNGKVKQIDNRKGTKYA